VARRKELKLNPLAIASRMRDNISREHVMDAFLPKSVTWKGEIDSQPLSVTGISRSLGSSQVHPQMHLVSTLNPLSKSEGNVPVALFVFEDQRKFLRISENYKVRSHFSFCPPFDFYFLRLYRTRFMPLVALSKSTMMT
jgi:hypothetical protein